MKHSYARQHPCEIQRISQVGNDFEGVPDEWETVGTSLVRFPRQSGFLAMNTERRDNYRMQNLIVQEGEMTASGFPVTTGMRLLCRGTTYNIRGVENVEGMNQLYRLALVNVNEGCADPC